MKNRGKERKIYLCTKVIRKKGGSCFVKQLPQRAKIHNNGTTISPLHDLTLYCYTNSQNIPSLIAQIKKNQITIKTT